MYILAALSKKKKYHLEFLPGWFNFSLIYPYRTYPIERKQCSREEFVFSFSLTYLRIRCYCSFVFDFLSSSSRVPLSSHLLFFCKRYLFPLGFKNTFLGSFPTRSVLCEWVPVASFFAKSFPNGRISILWEIPLTILWQMKGLMLGKSRC